MTLPDAELTQPYCDDSGCASGGWLDAVDITAAQLAQAVASQLPEQLSVITIDGSDGMLAVVFEGPRDGPPTTAAIEAQRLAAETRLRAGTEAELLPGESLKRVTVHPLELSPADLPLADP